MAGTGIFVLMSSKERKAHLYLTSWYHKVSRYNLVEIQGFCYIIVPALLRR